MGSKLTYSEACHAMQTGVAFEMARDGAEGPTSPKHLRVGVNSAMVNDAALVRLLVAKGIITEHEYAEAVTEEMNREVQRYQERIKALYGADVELR